MGVVYIENWFRFAKYFYMVNTLSPHKHSPVEFCTWNCDIKHVCIIKVYLVKYVNSHIRHIRHSSPWGKESRIIFVIKFKLNILLALVVLLCGFISKGDL